MARTTDKFFELIEKTFAVDEITPQKILDEFYSGTFTKVKWGKDKKGKQRYGESKATDKGQSTFMSLAEGLSKGRKIYEEVDVETDYDALRKLRNRAKDLDIHSKVVVEKAQTKMDGISEELIKLKEERVKKRLSLEKQERALGKISGRITEASESELIILERRLDKLEEIDLSEAIDAIEERREVILVEKELRLQEQEAAREEKERLRALGIEPEF